MKEQEQHWASSLFSFSSLATDGGRVAQAVFGRGVKKAVGQIFLLTVFLVGVLGSDLFLFYFAFLIAFQTGNEIPGTKSLPLNLTARKNSSQFYLSAVILARNEVDKVRYVDHSALFLVVFVRVIVANSSSFYPFSFPRVLVATATTVLALLTLIPFQ